jgi:photosystem II cytochrome c550
MLKSWFTRCFIAFLLLYWGSLVNSPLVQAGDIDDYIVRYLKVTEPVPIAMNATGETQLFSPEQLTQGKRLFEDNCKNCHVGGATLPNPMQSLSLENLQGATPPRDNIGSLIAFQREPTIYDGSDISFWCRQVPDTWLPDQELAKLDAFVLRAAQVAEGWGSEDVEDGIDFT